MPALILSRKARQSITIGSQVEVEVLEITRGHVRLRVKAPRNVAVDRAEVREKKLANPLPEKELETGEALP